jgi:hypothetical protein
MVCKRWKKKRKRTNLGVSRTDAVADLAKFVNPAARLQLMYDDFMSICIPL